MKKILIPTDFSDNAGVALDYALHLVKGQKASIHIVNVVSPQIVATDVPTPMVDMSSELLVAANKAMQAIELFSKSFYGEGEQAKVVVTTHVDVGGVDYIIKEQAKIFDADLIIMGTQGNNHSFVDKILGTVSSAMLSFAPCPVILVPNSYKYKVIKNVVFATNLNHGDPFELWRATELLKPNVEVVRCVYVENSKNEVSEKELETFAKYMVENSSSIQTTFNVERGDNIEKTLSEYAKNYDAELIIMHRSKKSIWSNIFDVRHTKKMSNWINLPLLVINEK